MTPQIGEGSFGDGVDAVRVSTVLGDRDGPVGTAWTLALATPSAGHSPFIVVAKPNLPVVPFTLLVPAVAITGSRHAELTRGAAQAGVAAAVLELRMDDPDGLVCLIASVWVGALADDEEVGVRQHPRGDQVGVATRRRGRAVARQPGGDRDAREPRLPRS